MNWHGHDIPQPDWVSPDGQHVLYRGDCLDILPQLPDGCVDAVVTDPPYGISHPCNFAERRRGGITDCRHDWPDVHGDGEPFDPRPILDLDLPTVLWGANYFASKLADTSGWLVWDKLRPDGLDQATCELAWTNCVKGVRRFTHLWNGCMKASEQQESYHPTQKPAALFWWLLSLPWLSKFSTILDPYMGSGPCAVACARLGRRSIGIEIEQKYFDIAVTRIDQECRQLKLFTGATA